MKTRHLLTENSIDRRVNKIISQLAHTEDFQEIRNIRSKILKIIPNARAKGGKYLAAVAYYYLNGDLADAEDRFRLNKLLLLLHNDSQIGFNDVLGATDFNGIGFDKLSEIMDWFVPTQKTYDSFESGDKIQKVGKYTIYRMDDFDDTKYISHLLDGTYWCIFNDRETFNYMTDGYTTYLCVADGYEKVLDISLREWIRRLRDNRFGEQANELMEYYSDDYMDDDVVYDTADEGCYGPFVTAPYRYNLPPGDEYGTSMFVVMVGKNSGEIAATYSRYNLPNMCDGDFLSDEDLSHLIGADCHEIFKPVTVNESKEHLIQSIINESVKRYFKKMRTL